MRELVLAGRKVATDRVQTVASPHTGEVLAEVGVASPAQLEEALAAADGAREAAGRLPTWKRAAILRDVAARLERDRERFARTLSAEAAKPIDLARGEVARAVQTFTFAAAELVTWRDEVLPLDASDRADGKWALTRRFPVGPVAAITPFNFPLNLVAHKVAPAIAAGCPLVLKPADKTPLSALALADAVLEAGWPGEALSVLNLRVEDAGPLVTDERVRLLSFTGSDAVGWQLKARAGKKRVLLELGGDAAVIVEPDVADWDGMIARIAFGGYAYAGQACISVQRVFVHADVRDRFVEDLARALETRVVVGPPDREGVTMSAVVDDRAVEKVRRVTDESERAGARRVCGGWREGRLFAPMLFTDVPPEAPLAREEAFGPVVFVNRYADLDDAIAQVNRSRFGLQAAIYTASLAAATRAFERLEVGGVMVNEVPTFRVDAMPYGGVKDSGLGREGLRYAWQEYTEPRLMVLPKG